QVPALKMAWNAFRTIYPDERAQELRAELAVLLAQRGETALALKIADLTTRAHLLPYIELQEKDKVLSECLDFARKYKELELLAILAEFQSADECKKTLEGAFIESSEIKDRDKVVELASRVVPLIAQSGNVAAAVESCQQIRVGRLQTETL